MHEPHYERSFCGPGDCGHGGNISGVCICMIAIALLVDPMQDAVCKMRFENAEASLAPVTSLPDEAR